MPSNPSADAAAHLRVDGVSKSFGARRVLTDVSFTVAGGERAGLIGENGTGKSTLLAIVAGLLDPDAGVVTCTAPGGQVRMDLLPQQAPFELTAPVTAAVEAAVAPVRELAEAVERAGAALAGNPDDPAVAARFDAALADAERADAWSVDTRIAATLAGLGLGDIPTSRPVGELSGGQQARLSLACHLLSSPDVLLLDEPTNHLDDAATGFLVETLRGWRGPVLLASHDRAFLDDAVTSLIDLDPLPLPQTVAGPLVGDGDGSGIGVTRFTGRYTDYLNARLDALDRWEQQYRDEQAELKRLRASARDGHQVGHEGAAPRTEARVSVKFYADRNAKVVSRRVKDATRRLDELTARQLRRPPKSLRFAGLDAAVPAPRTLAGPVLVATRVAVAGRLAATTLSISAGEKWLVTGANGTGKSTLLQVLAGALPPTSGTVTRPGRLRVGLLSQDGDLPDPQARGEHRSARTAYADLVGADRAEAVPLSTFGLLAGRDENRPVGLLSVGQRRRLSLAVVLADPPDVLLLDEPTNHLSLYLAVELEAAIPQYPGAVVIASHDRWTRQRWTGRRLCLD